MLWTVYRLTVLLLAAAVLTACGTGAPSDSDDPGGPSAAATDPAEAEPSEVESSAEPSAVSSEGPATGAEPCLPSDYAQAIGQIAGGQPASDVSYDELATALNELDLAPGTLAAYRDDLVALLRQEEPDEFELFGAANAFIAEVTMGEGGVATDC